MTHSPSPQSAQPPCPPPALRSSLPNPVTLLRVRGEDAFSYLQSQVTADLRAAGEQWVRYALWLDARGYVQADTFILRETADSFLLFSYDTPAEQLETIVLSNVIADDVEIEHLGAVYRHWALWAQTSADAKSAPKEGEGAATSAPKGDSVGEKSAPKESDAGATLSFLPPVVQPQEGRFCVVSVHNAEGKPALPALLFAGRNASVANYDLLIPQSAALPAFASLLAEVAWGQRQERRIVDGVPAVPADIGPGDLPQEGGDLVKSAVSTAKGCYLGQEVIARWHATGQVRSGLFRVQRLADELAEGSVAALPVRLYAGAKPVGELRSYAPHSGAGLALLRLHRLGDARELALEAGAAAAFKVLEPVVS